MGFDSWHQHFLAKKSLVLSRIYMFFLAHHSRPRRLIFKSTTSTYILAEGTPPPFCQLHTTKLTGFWLWALETALGICLIHGSYRKSSLLHTAVEAEIVAVLSHQLNTLPSQTESTVPGRFAKHQVGSKKGYKAMALMTLVWCKRIKIRKIRQLSIW